MCCRGTHAAAPHDDKQKDVEASEADLFHGVLHRERLLCRNTGEGFIFLFLTAVTSQHKLQEPLPNPSHLPPDAPPPNKGLSDLLWRRGRSFNTHHCCCSPAGLQLSPAAGWRSPAESAWTPPSPTGPDLQEHLRHFHNRN